MKTALKRVGPDSRYSELLESFDAGSAASLEAVAKVLKERPQDNYAPLLRLLFNLDGRPYSLDDHLPFEPFFDRVVPPFSVAKSGRQLGKSRFQAARGILVANSVPHFKVLYIFPLYEQVRRFSDGYVRSFIDESPCRQDWVREGAKQNVLQKEFSNGSSITLSFAGQSVDRIRGLSAGMVNFDEAQDIDPNHLPVILEVTSASAVYDDLGNKFYRSSVTFSGTPKTMDTALEQQWNLSSQAEWEIKCEACGKLNIPSIEHDLLRMIGPYHADIGEAHKGKKPGTICASSKCGRPVDPRSGRWVHKRPELAEEFPGRHIPQVIMPMHFAEPRQWRKLVGKMEGGYSKARFYNEVLGESFDLGHHVISETSLKAACVLPWENNPRSISHQVARAKTYDEVHMGVDWGGGGDDGISFTTIAVIGVRSDGIVDVIYGERLIPDDPAEEASRILRVYSAFRCRLFAHDYNGAGNLREAFMVHSGLPLDRIYPFVYNRTAFKDMVVLHRAGDNDNSRNYWILDKARSLQLTCEMIRQRRIRFFKYDYRSIDDRGLVHDFTSLVEHKYETARAGEVYGIRGSGTLPDDFAHSVNFACLALWHSRQDYPNLLDANKYRVTAAQHSAFNPDISLDLDAMGDV